MKRGGSVKKDGMGISMDRRKGGMGNLSVDTRRVTTENAPILHFCETRKDSQPVLADSSKRQRNGKKVPGRGAPGNAANRLAQFKISQIIYCK